MSRAADTCGVRGTSAATSRRAVLLIASSRGSASVASGAIVGPWIDVGEKYKNNGRSLNCAACWCTTCRTLGAMERPRTGTAHTPSTRRGGESGGALDAARAARTHVDRAAREQPCAVLVGRVRGGAVVHVFEARRVGRADVRAVKAVRPVQEALLSGCEVVVIRHECALREGERRYGARRRKHTEDEVVASFARLAHRWQVAAGAVRRKVARAPRSEGRSFRGGEEEGDD